MDMRTYAGTRFLKPEDVRDQSLKEQIAVVKPPAENAKYPKPSLVFESGKMLGLNQTSIGHLMKEFGPESDSWVGKWVTVGAEMIDVFSGQSECIIVRPLDVEISDPKQVNGKVSFKSPKPKCEPGDNKDIDDEIPF
jgi:hypothetical protein